MKNIIYLFVLLPVIWIISCDNKIDVTVPTFDVKTEKLTYHVNDTVYFDFLSDAEYITFYSGDKGAEYKHRFRTQIDGARPVLNFNTRSRYGAPERNLSLLISTNFNGTMDTENILKADWQDISDRVAFSTGVEISSGDIDLSDFIDFPQISLAFKFIGIGWTEVAQKNWFVTNFSLMTFDEENNTYPIVNTLPDGGWLEHSVEGDTRKWRITPDDLYFGANGGEPSNEDWVITKKLNIASINPDNGVPIKTLTGTAEPLSYAYSSPGEYVVTFVAKNQSIYGEQEVIKEIHLSIIP